MLFIWQRKSVMLPLLSGESPSERVNAAYMSKLPIVMYDLSWSPFASTTDCGMLPFSSDDNESWIA